MSRVLVVTLSVCCVLASGAWAACPKGQELRELKFPGTQLAQERGCAKKGADGRDVREGPWVEFYLSGKKRSAVTYKGGKLEGVCTWYYENGKKQFEYAHRDGKMDGLGTEWTEQGELKSQALYKDDNLVKAP